MTSKSRLVRRGPTPTSRRAPSDGGIAIGASRPVVWLLGLQRAGDLVGARADVQRARRRDDLDVDDPAPTGRAPGCAGSARRRRRCRCRAARPAWTDEDAHRPSSSQRWAPVRAGRMGPRGRRRTRHHYPATRVPRMRPLAALVAVGLLAGGVPGMKTSAAPAVLCPPAIPSPDDVVDQSATTACQRRLACRRLAGPTVSASCTASTRRRCRPIAPAIVGTLAVRRR